MGKGFRAGRLSEEIRKITSDLLLRELKDPRLSEGMVSVSAVEVTSDGSYATIYLTVFQLGTKEELDKKKEDVLAAMRSAKGVIKKEIGKQVKLRHIPDLIFKMDESLDYGRHIEELINKVVKTDDEQ
ncbi:MAG: 30S ribosome-binding factor RbfA [Anaerovoracaceae bacterium]